MYYEDTIAAISTPLGRGGIGIVRVSGPDALGIGDRVFISRSGSKLSEIEPWRLSLGKIYDGDPGRVIDEVLVAFMPAPKTYTREDIVEINCHSGLVVLDRILQLVLREGARLAEPGEFTLRAFLNGRIDLPQAEAVLEVVDSKTNRALRGAVDRLKGGTSEMIVVLRQAILEELAVVEASIDFIEEDIPDHKEEDVIAALEPICKRIREIIKGGKVEKIYCEGILLAIIGAPNVGKSSLFNALLEEDRAIVTDIPGTTSDIIQEYLSIEGIPVRIADTAGIRTPRWEVEAEGVRRSLRAIEESDVVLLLIDGSDLPAPEDDALFEMVDKGRVVLVVNKSDLGVVGEMLSWCEDKKGIPAVHTSAIHGEGLGELGLAIKGRVIKGVQGGAEPAIIANSRQIATLERALGDLEKAICSAFNGEGMEIASFYLREAVHDIDEIRGSGISEQILDEIFKRFCVGK